MSLTNTQLNELAKRMGFKLALKANLASPTFTGTVSGITKAMVGLANVDNTADASKPVSSATTTALALKANLASPTFTGTVGGITAAMVGLGNCDNTSDANKPVPAAVATALALKSPLASPTFTGVVTCPGLTLSDNIMLPSSYVAPTAGQLGYIFPSANITFVNVAYTASAFALIGTIASLPAGVWLMNARIHLRNSTTTASTSYFYTYLSKSSTGNNGTLNFLNNNSNVNGNTEVGMMMSLVIQNSATTTYYIGGMTNSTFNTTTTNNANCWCQLVRIA